MVAEPHRGAQGMPDAIDEDENPRRGSGAEAMRVQVCLAVIVLNEAVAHPRRPQVVVAADFGVAEKYARVVGGARGRPFKRNFSV